MSRATEDQLKAALMVEREKVLELQAQIEPLARKLQETEFALEMAMEDNFNLARKMGMQLDAGPSMRGGTAEPAEEQLP